MIVRLVLDSLVALMPYTFRIHHLHVRQPDHYGLLR